MNATRRGDTLTECFREDNTVTSFASDGAHILIDIIVQVAVFVRQVDVGFVAARYTAEPAASGVAVGVFELVCDRYKPIGEVSVAKAEKTVPTARIVATVQAPARERRRTRMDVDMIETKGAAAELAEDWRDERVVD